MSESGWEWSGVRVGESESVSVSECVSEWEHVRVSKSECGS